MEAQLMRRLIPLLAAAPLAVTLAAAPATAQQLDTHKLTHVTFSAPVSIPGATLPAGAYTFKLLDSAAQRNVIQVFDRDQTKVLATIIAMSAERPKPASETVITFREAASNAPPALHYWYYPGERLGWEFAYPKEQATKIANASRESVLSVDAPADDMDAMKSGAISRVEPGADTAQAAPAKDGKKSNDGKAKKDGKK
jgi:hypothetical protein